MSNNDTYSMICENFEITIGGEENSEGAVMTFDIADIQPYGLNHISYFEIRDEGIHVGFSESSDSKEILPVIFPLNVNEHLLIAQIKEKYGRIYVAALASDDDDPENVNIAFSREMLLSN